MPHSANSDNAANAPSWHAVTERVLDAAVRCMARSGLKVSMSDVAAEAGVSRGVLYRHFAGRQALVEAVVERTVDRILEDAARQVDACPTLATQVAAAIRYMPDSRVEPLVTVLDGAPAERGAWLSGRWRTFWLPRLTAAQQRGEVRDDLVLPDAADWITRVQMSFTYETPGDLEGEGVLDHYVGEHLLRGLGRR